jgi:hypothetical protein
VALQGIASPQAPSGTREQHQGLRLAVLCVNHIPLNQVTHIIVYRIPCCNMAVKGGFGGSWIWLDDAPMGYHQISASKATQEKLALQGPDAIKWTYNLMPFGPTNGPATFVAMIHGLDRVWKGIAVLEGLTIGRCIDTTIIVDDILNWAKDWGGAQYSPPPRFLPQPPVVKPRVAFMWHFTVLH